MSKLSKSYSWAALLILGVAVAVCAFWFWNRRPSARWQDMSPAMRVAAIRDTRATPDVDLLLQALTDEDTDVRLVAVMHLRGLESRGAEIARALIEALKDSHAGVRREAAESLSKIGPESGPALTEAPKDPNPRVRAGAALALGDIGSVMGMGRVRPDGEARRIEPLLQKLLEDDDPEVRQNAAHTLKVIEWEVRAPR